MTIGEAIDHILVLPTDKCDRTDPAGQTGAHLARAGHDVRVLPMSTSGRHSTADALTEALFGSLHVIKRGIASVDLFAALSVGTTVATNSGNAMDATSHPDEELGFKRGRGNWKVFDLPLERVYRSAERWRGLVEPIEKPWLCWNVEPNWCLLQQKLVDRAGWTPIVGFDPRVGPPPLLKQSVLINFNEDFRFPVLFPHFVIEFAFLFAKRLAFWHSDLLLDEARMRRFAELFAQVPDGEMIATYSRGGGYRRFLPLLHRYWELLGCTTRGASQSQFDHGTGWWMHYYAHPNFSGSVYLQSKRWEYGFGINAWRMNFGGTVKKIPVDLVRDGHFTRIGNPGYARRTKNNVFRDLSWDIQQNFALQDCAKTMGLTHLLEPHQATGVPLRS